MYRFAFPILIFFASLGSSLIRAQSVIHVGSYGAIPDDGVNDIPAIRNAIAALPPSNAILEFSGGVYDLYPVTTLGMPTTTKGTIFSITSKTNLVIRGNGATLLCHEFTPFRQFDSSYFDLFFVWDCTDVEFQDLIVNMSRLPYTIGTCTSINWTPTIGLRSFRASIDPSFIPPGGTLNGMSIHALTNWHGGVPNGQRFFYVQQATPLLTGNDFYVAGISNTVLHDVKGRGAANSGHPGYEMMSDLPNPANPNVKDQGRLMAGDDVILVHQFSGYIAFIFVDCKRSFLTNLTVHSWPGMAVNLSRDQDVVIDGLAVIPDPQRPWLVTTTADAIHMANISGTVQVQGCHLEGMLDDGFNSFTSILVPATTQPSLPTTMDLLAKNVGWTYPAGTVWEFYDSNMIPLGTRALTTVSSNLTQPDRHRLTFGSLPAGTIAYVCNLDQFPSSTDLSGTSVVGNRGNGFFLRRNTTVGACSFTDLSGSGLNIGPSVGYWNEGPGGAGGTGITILDSQFQSCNRGWGLYAHGEGTINVRTMIYTGTVWTTGPMGSISDVTLSGLTFLDSGGSAIAVRSCERISIDACQFGSTGDLWLLPNNPAPPGFGAGNFAAQSLLFFHESRDVSITNNTTLPGAVIQNGDRVWSWAQMYGSYVKLWNAGF